MTIRLASCLPEWRPFVCQQRPACEIQVITFVSFLSPGRGRCCAGYCFMCSMTPRCLCPPRTKGGKPRSSIARPSRSFSEGFRPRPRLFAQDNSSTRRRKARLCFGFKWSLPDVAMFGVCVLFSFIETGRHARNIREGDRF